jgi:hypothetical protein
MRPRSAASRSVLPRFLGQIALLPLAAFAVHQLRFMLAFGGSAGAELQRTGHAYLHSLVPWMVLLLALVAGGFLRALGRALSGHGDSPARYSLSLAGLWLACSGCLIAIYVSQELLEGWFALGHPVGLAGVFGYGGWWALPAAAAVGLVLAAWFHGARWVLQEVARRRARPLTYPTRSSRALIRPRDAFAPVLAPLTGGWSGRGPPV